jgi:hypothetical protein
LSALVLLVATSSTSDARAHRTTRANCSPGHTRTLAADARAQVYVLEERTRQGTRTAFRGCVYGHARSYLLGVLEPGSAASPGSTSEHFVLAGSIVAYEEAEVGGLEPQGSWIVIVQDLRTGRTLREVPTGTPNPRTPSFTGAGEAVALVVKTDGAVAWITDTDQGVNRYEVHAADRHGSLLLASGSDIDPSSLALARSTLYWTQGGKPFSMALN